MGTLIYDQDVLPPNSSDYMVKLAKHLWNVKDYWHHARRPLEAIWTECDNAYLCYRQLPISEGMPWMDLSDFGETDIHDGVNQLAMSLSLAIMPKDRSWLTVVGKEADTPQLINAIQAQQLWMHYKARTRRSYARHLKQLIVRGTSAIFWKWQQEIRYRRLSNIDALTRMSKQMGVDPKQIKLIGQVRESFTKFNGPLIRPLDAYDLFLDPEADLVCDRQVASIVQTYRRLSDLVAEQDPDTSEPVYDNLLAAKGADSDIMPWNAEEIYFGDTDGNKRLLSLNTMGVFPQNSADAGTKLVPVYIFHYQYLKFDDKEFYDTYFHVAINREGNEARMIRVEENPSDHGHDHISVDGYVDWFTNVAYGISGVEKNLSAYRQLNVLSAVLLQAMMTAGFPPYLMQSGILKEDQGVNVAPGAITEIAMGGLGLDFIKPFPTPDRGVELGLNDSRWFKQKVAQGFGNMGGTTENDPNASISSRETATSVNAKTTSGSRAIDEQAEKFADSLQEVCQGILDMSRQMLEGDQVDGQLIFNQQSMGGQTREASIKFDDFDKDRSVQVLGLHGVMNAAQEIQQMTEALDIVGRTSQWLPNAPALAQKIAMTLLSKLHIEVDPQAELSPQELAAMDPRVQQMAISIAMKSPQFQQAMMQASQGGNGGQPINVQGNGQPQAQGPAPGGQPGNGITQPVRPAQGPRAVPK